ncbi:CRISPR-associated helicase Cas3', partial [Candidatus Bathyarchaeota archaeon]|nr:CRISPR-associated helicase Cas3' [Candidatus Bathyarchaeota archaeon]
MDFSELALSISQIGDFCRLVGLSHDFGKATPFFQKYLFTEDTYEKNKLKALPETKHSLLSSLFSFYLIRNNFMYFDKDVSTLLPLIGFEIVRRHHGSLKNVALDSLIPRLDEREALFKQVKSLNPSLLTTIYDGLIDEANITNFIESIEDTLEEIKHAGWRIKHLDGKGMLFSVLTELCYSILLEADRGDAAQISATRRDIECSMVDRYRTINGFDKPVETIDLIRDEVYREVVLKADRIDLEKRVYSLTAPTGTGKTLAALGFALRLRERLIREKGVSPKIIYCISFTSIIDQNYAVFESVFREIMGRPPKSGEMLKHHYLADLSKWIEDDEELDPDESLFLIEGWNSEVIFTTFVQFFQTLLLGRSRSVRKYHNLVNSIIIFDEAQTLPHRYWLLFRELTLLISKVFKTYFIFMTATQPLIFDQGDLDELLPQKEKYYKSLNRVELNVDLTPIKLDEFVKVVEEDIKSNPDKSFLIVLNTINSSQNVYRSLNRDSLSRECYYLSTFVVPKDRLSRIIGARSKTSRKVIVSTQLVEAGVDIDVDIVYRDFAPLDSINQVSGRCNRNAMRECGSVNVYNVIDERGRPLHTYIYGRDRVVLDKTRELLEGLTVLPESKFLETIERYYRLIRSAKSDDESRNLLRGFQKLDFSKMRESFNLIEEDQPEMDVFVEIDKEASRLWRQYLKIREIRDFAKRKKEFSLIKRRFYDYVISVPVKYKNQAGYDEELKIGYIPGILVGERGIYNKEVGFQ